MATRKKKALLIAEPYPADYNGYPFVTLIKYRQMTYLTIVDNINSETITAYVLDMCGAEGVNELEFIDIARTWFEHKSRPLSIEIGKLGLSDTYSCILRTFSLDFVSRVIGPVHNFPLNVVKYVRRRRTRKIPDIKYQSTKQ